MYFFYYSLGYSSPKYHRLSVGRQEPVKALSPRSIRCNIIPTSLPFVGGETKGSVGCCKHFYDREMKGEYLQIQLFKAVLILLAGCSGPMLGR